MKILLPVDGSECTRLRVAYLAAHDELFGPRHDDVMLFDVDHLPVHVASLLDPRAIDEHRHREVESVFAPLRMHARVVLRQGARACGCSPVASSSSRKARRPGPQGS
jgi:hypothetical protein